MSVKRNSSCVKGYEDIPIIIVEKPSPPMERKTTQETSLSVENEKSKGKNPDDEILETSDIEENSGERRLSLRRNSISLPNLDELKVLTEQVRVSY